MQKVLFERQVNILCKSNFALLPFFFISFSPIFSCERSTVFRIEFCIITKHTCIPCPDPIGDLPFEEYLVGFNFKTVRLVSMNKCNALLVGPIKCLRFWAQKVYHRQVKNYDTVDYEMQFLKNSETLQEASNKIIRPSIED